MAFSLFHDNIVLNNDGHVVLALVVLAVVDASDGATDIVSVDGIDITTADNAQ